MYGYSLGLNIAAQQGTKLNELLNILTLTVDEVEYDLTLNVEGEEYYLELNT